MPGSFCTGWASPTKPMPGPRPSPEGQQQRVAIARALAPSPRVLLCDEPTSALDPELSEEVVEVLAKLARDGTTMVMATHDLRLAFRTAQQVAFLDGGVVVEQGEAARCSARPGKNERNASSRRSPAWSAKPLP